MIRKIILISIAACSLTLFASFQNPSPTAKSQPRNVILLVGDGMGLSQISYALIQATERMNIEKFKSCGFSKTSASNHKITDSAAGATAFACGHKTYNGAIAVDDQKKSLPTILEMAEKMGMATGLIATCAITHATPASFIAHQPSRDMAEAIAADFLATDIDLFIGGGRNHFNNRKDQQDLLKTLRERGYDVVTDQAALNAHDPNKKLAALLAPNHLPKMQDGRGNYLSEATTLGINQLSQNKNGFFLMVEGSQIDWGGHSNDAAYILEEMRDFDKAIGIALAFAEKQGNTLVIVTADHETGGFALSGNEDDKTNPNLSPGFVTKNHTATMVPVFAYGPGAEQLQGVYENTEIFYVMKKTLGIK